MNTRIDKLVTKEATPRTYWRASLPMEITLLTWDCCLNIGNISSSWLGSKEEAMAELRKRLESVQTCVSNLLALHSNDMAEMALKRKQEQEQERARATAKTENSEVAKEGTATS